MAASMVFRFTAFILARLLLQVLGEGAAASWFCIFERLLSILALLLGLLVAAVAQASQSHIAAVAMEAQREVGAGGPRMQVAQAVNGGPRLGGVILTDPTTVRSCSAIRS